MSQRHCMCGKVRSLRKCAEETWSCQQVSILRYFTGLIQSEKIRGKGAFYLGQGMSGNLKKCQGKS